MSIAIPSARVSLEGQLPGSELFVTSFWVAPAFHDQAGLNAALAAVGSHFSPNESAFLDLCNPSTVYTTVRIGYYAANATSQLFSGEAAIPGGGGNGTGPQVLPNQAALCLTLRTPQTGRRYRGRMYLPATGAALALPAGNVDPAKALAVCNKAKAFFDALNADPAVGIVSVASQAAGILTRVNRVGVDTRLDIQRRRANRQTITGGYEAPLV